MAKWWYSYKEKEVGPVEEGEIENLLKSGDVVDATLIWTEGWASWRPFSEVDQLQHLKRKIPPPIPPKPILSELEYPMASNWRRFFARIFDLWLGIVLVGGVIGFTVGLTSPVYTEMLNNANNILLGLILTPLALVFDAGVYGFFGNTPGKALAGLRVGNFDATHLTTKEYLGRNLSLWVSGLAFGLPIVYLFTMATQSGRIKKGQQTTYDFETGYRVRAKPSSWKNDTLFIVLFVSLFAVVVALNVVDHQSKKEAVRETISGNYSWINPVTGQNAMINQSWGNQIQKNEDGQTVYLFSERTNNAAVIFGMEQGPNLSLSKYVQLFRENVVGNMKFSDAGIYDKYLGADRWVAQGTMTDNQNNFVRVQIVQLNDKFWRVVTIQTIPHGTTDLLVEELHSSLWDTVVNF